MSENEEPSSSIDPSVEEAKAAAAMREYMRLWMIWQSEDLLQTLTGPLTPEELCQRLKEGRETLHEWPGGKESFKEILLSRRADTPTYAQWQIQGTGRNVAQGIDPVLFQHPSLMPGSPEWEAYYSDFEINVWFEQTFHIPRTPENESFVRNQVAEMRFEEKWLPYGVKATPENMRLIANAALAAEEDLRAVPSYNPQACKERLQQKADAESERFGTPEFPLVTEGGESLADGPGSKDGTGASRKKACIEYHANTVVRPADGALTNAWMEENPGFCAKYDTTRSQTDLPAVPKQSSKKVTEL